VDGDAELMSRAVEAGEHARRRTAPNPWVGCVLARDGVIIAEGASDPPGGPHAEVNALARAANAAGATAYTTLEPCSHHGRTPPCADALLEAGVARVVTALEDPDENVRGSGIARLRAAGVEVTVGVGAEQARRSLAPYLHQRATGRAFCLAKVAMSLDGRIAAADGSSQWITGVAARADAHELRADAQAVVVGSGTALADDPALTVRDVEPQPRVPPLRVLLDGRGRVPARGQLFDQELGATLVITTDGAAAGAVDAWRAAGAKVETVQPGHGGHGLDLGAVLALLGGHGVLQAMVEGGASVLGALAADALIDRLVAYVAPKVLGTDGLPAFGWSGPATLADARTLHLVGTTPISDDVRIDYERSTG